MEFTEVKEINEMIQHSKSYYSSVLELQRNPHAKDSSNFGYEDTRDDFCDYDQALQDSPRSTNLKHDFLETLSDVLRFAEEESLENLLQEISSQTKDTVQEGKLEVEKLKKETDSSDIVKNFAGEIVEHPNESDSDSDIDSQKKDPDESKNSERQTTGQSLPKGMIAKSVGFEKLPTDMITNNSQIKRSILSQTMKEQPRKHNSLKPGSMRGGNKSILKEFKVYFWKTNLSLNISLNVSATVTEVIRQIIESYLNSSSVDQSLMKYPKYTEAYELRMLENDDDYKPEMGFSALDKSKAFIEFNIQKGVAFLEVPKFKAPEENEKDTQSKHNQIQAILNTINKIHVHVHAVEENFKSSLQIDPEEPIKALFPKIATKLKNISSKTHQLRICQSDPEQRLLEKGNFLDINMPIKNLKSKAGGLELEIVKRKFADDPTDMQGPSRRTQSKAAELSQSLSLSYTEVPMEYEENVFLYNDVSACHYEEFEVIKINQRAKKQPRVIGIDGFKIYNLPKKYKEQNSRLNGLFSGVLFTKLTTKHPERLMRDVKDAKVKKDNFLSIEVRVENGGTKSLDYEASDKKTAQQIVAKIRYIKNLERRNH